MPSTTTASSLAAPVPVRSRRLSPAASFSLLLSIGVAYLAGSAAPTPLYAVYQAAWGFSPVTVTVIFGVYALAVLTTLLTLGSLSDYIGRRPVLVAATAMQAVAMLVFASAESVTALLLARVIQGLSTGAAVSALGAGLLDLDRPRGTIANAIAPMTGTATGGLASGLMIEYLPAPTRLIYLVFFAVFVLQAVAVLWMAEPVTPRPGALASLRPQLRVPPAVRRVFLLAVPMLIAAWAVPGFYGSIGPALVRAIVGSRSLVLGGLTLFVLAGSGALTVFLLRSRPALLMMRLGAAALVAGVGVTLVAAATSAAGLFFTGAVIAGIGFGAGFQGAIRMVVPLTAAHERAGVLSVLYVVSYLALGIPAVIAGLMVVRGGGLLPTARAYGLAVMLLAAVALFGSAAAGRDHIVGK
jgi:MFS family permease